MTTGTVRNIPSSIDDITPDGADLDQLTQSQIDVARTSGFLEDTPGAPIENPGLIEPDQVSQPPDPDPDPDNRIAPQLADPPPNNWIAALPESTDKLLPNDASSGGGSESASPFEFSKLRGAAARSKPVNPVNVPEPFISPLIWLGLAAAGMFYRRRPANGD